MDNAVPTAATSLTPTTDDDGDFTFSGTVTDSETTSCTLQFVGGTTIPGGDSQAMTYSGDTCSLIVTDVPESIYTWFIRASDETNTTDSSEQQTNIDVDSGGGGTLPVCGNGICEVGETVGGNVVCLADCPDGQVPPPSRNGMILLVLGIIGLVVWFIFIK